MITLPVQRDDSHDIGPELKGDSWSVDITNWRELGNAIATFNKAIGTDAFVGTATMIVEDGMRRVEITLYHDEVEQYRCSVCKAIPVHPTMDNPGICVFCGNKVCANCAIAHERQHWRPVRTIGGDAMCDGDKVKCGHDQCPKCGGSPF